jgi:biopolymer transport protein ExbD
MAGHTAERTADDHLDLVPMIDCIMLLLLFLGYGHLSAPV